MPDDPDAPLLAVLAAADAAEPRIVRPASDGCMCEGWRPRPVEQAADRHRRIARALWRAVTPDPPTQRDYIGVQ